MSIGQQYFRGDSKIAEKLKNQLGQLKDRIDSWADRQNETKFMPRLAATMFIVCALALVGMGMHFDRAELVSATHVIGLGTSQKEPVAKDKESKEPASGYTVVKLTAAEKLDKLCGFARSVAGTYKDTSIRSDDTKYYCTFANRALELNRTKECTANLAKIPLHVHDDKLNKITKGAVAAACNDLDGLDHMINNGTAANPIHPVFNNGYSGIDPITSGTKLVPAN